jgi:hypothetical protein
MILILLALLSLAHSSLREALTAYALRTVHDNDVEVIDPGGAGDIGGMYSIVLRKPFLK